MDRRREAGSFASTARTHVPPALFTRGARPTVQKEEQLG